MAASNETPAGSFYFTLFVVRRVEMANRSMAKLVTRAAVMMLMMWLFLGVFTVVEAGRDRKPPTTPTNLHVTGMTSYTVSLAWNPSIDNSGSFVYRVRHSWGYEVTVPQTETSYTWTGNLEAGRTYSFYVYAIDGSGNRSGNSNTVTVTLPPDTIPPSQPVVAVTDVGPTHVSLTWSSVEDGPFVWFWIYKDGNPVLQGTRETAGTIFLLEPETSYVFTVKARDFGMNWSPLSEPVSVTTDPSNPNDHTPPTTPTNLSEDHWDNEIHVRWNQSTDDLDPQSIIRYDVYVNGVFDHSLVGSGGPAIVYGEPGQNTIEIIAVDTAGNESAPAVILVNI
jgi:fibronectin type 3 domain-containing protein